MSTIILHAEYESERVTDGKMESLVILPFEISETPRLSLCYLGRIVCFQAKIETHQEICEIETQANSVAQRHLLVEIRKMELSARLCIVLVQRPHISCIGKQRALNAPKHFEPIFNVQIKLYISRLVHIVDIVGV